MSNIIFYVICGFITSMPMLYYIILIFYNLICNRRNFISNSQIITIQIPNEVSVEINSITIDMNNVRVDMTNIDKDREKLPVAYLV